MLKVTFSLLRVSVIDGLIFDRIETVRNTIDLCIVCRHVEPGLSAQNQRQSAGLTSKVSTKKFERYSGKSMIRTLSLKFV